MNNEALLDHIIKRNGINQDGTRNDLPVIIPHIKNYIGLFLRLLVSTLFYILKNIKLEIT